MTEVAVIMATRQLYVVTWLYLRKHVVHRHKGTLFNTSSFAHWEAFSSSNPNLPLFELVRAGYIYAQKVPSDWKQRFCANACLGSASITSSVRTCFVFDFIKRKYCTNFILDNFQTGGCPKDEDNPDWQRSRCPGDGHSDHSRPWCKWVSKNNGYDTE